MILFLAAEGEDYFTNIIQFVNRTILRAHADE